MSVRIIIDSACDLTKEQADELQTTFLPLKTIFGEEEFLDGITLSHRQFFEKLIESDCMPTTSQIPPHEYETVFQEVKEAGDTAVVITISSKLSGTYQSANIARDGYEDCIWLVDSENVCIGEQILVRYACRLRDTGASAAEIAAILDQRKKDVRVIALLDTLEYLKRGGRISGAAAFAGGLLSIKPVIAIADGEVAILGKARGSKNGNNMLREETAKCGGIDFTMPFSLAYSGLDDSLLQKYIADNAAMWQEQVSELPISTIGSTIGTHAGPGAIAVAFFATPE
ncbi:MAG: DegV family protein [Clostridiales bacterium]|nr:DegV family protein [Roseburia sp.]MDD7637968.1 DegV family protein [Clostridiales bacterium]MDY4112043.1 DegV family protein [Roseburia sp.]